MTSIAEPEIRSDDFLILNDESYRPDNICVVTGAANGIGRATALAAAANGLTTVALDIDVGGGRRTEEMARQIGGRVIFIPTDLRDDRQLERAIEEAAKLGSIKYLANIAGMQHVAPLDQFPMEKYDLMQQVMLRAPFYLSRLVLPHLRRSADGTGAIGNMASIHAHVSTLNKAAYNVLKFAIRGLTQSIAAEGEGKVRAFSISTGYVRTALALGQIPAQAAQRGITPEIVVRDIMLGRSRAKEMMTPVDVANLFIFGFSRYAKYLIGGDLLFDGGVVLTY